MDLKGGLETSERQGLWQWTAAVVKQLPPLLSADGIFNNVRGVSEHTEHVGGLRSGLSCRSGLRNFNGCLDTL